MSKKKENIVLEDESTKEIAKLIEPNEDSSSCSNRENEIAITSSDVNEEKTKIEMPKGQVIEKFNYNIKADESGEGYKFYQRQYVRKYNIKITIGIGFAFLCFLILTIIDPKSGINWVASLVMLTAIAILWLNPIILRKSIVKALKPLENDTYIFSIFEDGFTIETIMSDKEFEDGEIRYQPEPMVIWFKDKNYIIQETEKIMLLIIGEKNQLIYFIPKRCFEPKQIEIIKENLK
ncbi:MAG: hypothetical protein GX896_08665 [Clostridiales bacterium]|nr:hypothetical protein [Clostridiales bacterium]